MSSQDKKISIIFFSYSVVTGSTDGIGRQYAKELASQGMNIVLISRTETKLIEVSKEIGKLYKSNWFTRTLSGKLAIGLECLNGF